VSHERSTSPTVSTATNTGSQASKGTVSPAAWVIFATGAVLFGLAIALASTVPYGRPFSNPEAGSTSLPANSEEGVTATGSWLPAEELFAKASPAVVGVEVRDRTFKLIGQGSGFLVSEDGVVATNHHVIRNAYFAHVTFPDGSKYAVEGVAASLPRFDLALVKIRGRQFPNLELAEDALPLVGSKVYAIGNPRGMTNSLSDGLVSGHRQIDGDFKFIQTTAAISPGSSGGPLLSADGHVLGVTTASIRDGQNLNLAVPVRALKAAISARGPLQTLASAGGEPLKTDDAQKLDDVWAAIGMQDYGKALKLLAVLRDSQENSAAYWFSVGFVQGELGNHQLAIDAWQTCIKIDPNDDTPYYNLGVSYQATSRDREAITAYKSALALKPDHVNALLNTGVAYFELNQYPQAISSFQSVTAIEPDNAKAYLSMGLANALLNQSAEAVRCFKTVVQLDPTNAQCYHWLGVELRRLRRYDEAIQASRSAIRLNPDNASAYTNIGECFTILGDNQEARRALEAAIEIDPRRASPHLLLGKCYLHDSVMELSAGRKRESVASERKAREHLQRAVELDPNGQTGKTAQKTLEIMAH
jgi:tetratricopeptide (TPR) repeat protein